MSAPARAYESPTEPLVAVVAAMQEEIAPLRARLTAARQLDAGPCRVSIGRLGSTRVALTVTGEGAAAAERGLEALLEALPVTRMLVVGISGGLSPDLGAGSVVVAEQVVDEDGTVAGIDAEPWSGDRPVNGTVCCGPRILSSAETKAAEHRRLGGPRHAAFDLESAALVRIAARHGIPWSVLRAVSDPADETLPIDFDRYRDSDGAVDRMRVLRHALGRPGLLLPLWRLRRRVVYCSNLLADLVDEQLRGGGR